MSDQQWNLPEGGAPQGQPGYPPQGYPQGQPGYVPAPLQGQPGQPHAGYGQQPCGQPQGYAAQPSVGQVPYRLPQPGGYQLPAPAPATRARGNALLTLVLGGLVLALVLGALMWALFFRSAPHRPDPIVPTMLPIPTQKDGSTTRPTSTSTTKQTTPASGGSAVEIAQGITLTPAAGWSVDTSASKPGVVVVTNEKTAFMAQVFTAEQGATSAQLLDAYLEQMKSTLQDAQALPAKTIDLGTDALDASSGRVEGTKVSGGQSENLSLYTLLSVRTSDQVSVLCVLFTDPEEADNQVQAFEEMAHSVMQSQAHG